MNQLSFLKKNNKGFSLIEIIMVLVLLGIMGALGASGITSFIEIFSRTKQSNDAVSAGQIAILRIAKELIAVNELDKNGSNSTKIQFTSYHKDGNHTLKIYKDTNGVVWLSEINPLTTTNKLVESVGSLNFDYYVWDSDNSTNPFQSDTPQWTGDRCSISIDKATFDNDANTTSFVITPLHPNSILNDHFNVKFGADTNSTITSPSGDNETCSFATTASSPTDVCKYAFIYDVNRANETMCFFKVAIAGDNATKIDNDCSTLPPMSSITGHTVTRIIKVTLQLKPYDAGADPYVLSIMVSPRNID